jgi:Skp family chaperone for outer membrane proteins
MRPAERIALFLGVILAIILALDARSGGATAMARASAADEIRIGMVDTFYVVEQIMGKPDLKKAREDIASQWAAKADAAEREIQDLQNTLRNLQPSDPQAQPTVQRYQDLQAKYQKIAEDRQNEVEQINSSQLTDAYKQARQATIAVADRQGYTHVFSSRSFDREFKTPTLAGTLQELLARPIIKGNPADDLTSQVVAELKLDEPK